MHITTSKHLEIGIVLTNFPQWNFFLAPDVEQIYEPWLNRRKSLSRRDSVNENALKLFSTFPSRKSSHRRIFTAKNNLGRSVKIWLTAEESNSQWVLCFSRIWIFVNCLKKIVEINQNSLPKIKPFSVSSGFQLLTRRCCLVTPTHVLQASEANKQKHRESLDNMQVTRRLSCKFLNSRLSWWLRRRIIGGD